MEPLLSVRDLTVHFVTPRGTVRAVNEVSYDVYPGETIGIVGESGSGKSVSVMSMLGLLPQPPARIVGGQITFDGRDLLQLPSSALRDIRGREIAMIFQDPMTSLNPVLSVGQQLVEAMRVHRRIKRKDARRRAAELLELVGVPNARARVDEYPHEFSGGMRQRVMIAMAIANQPKLLIADEPTTALDVTVQAQVMEVLQEAKEETDAATILITHDLGLVAEFADRVMVMYGGRIVESGPVHAIFNDPRHPYTLGLMGSLPRLDVDLDHLVPVVGSPPDLIDLPPGCSFAPRCRLGEGRSRCTQELPLLLDIGKQHRSACHFHDEMAAQTEQLEAELGAEIGASE
jgi:oligopeptide/dipeptide ABC transporter ATP-binding protein